MEMEWNGIAEVLLECRDARGFSSLVSSAAFFQLPTVAFPAIFSVSCFLALLSMDCWCVCVFFIASELRWLSIPLILVWSFMPLSPFTSIRLRGFDAFISLLCVSLDLIRTNAGRAVLRRFESP